jgi:IMP dehydrogenase
MREALSFDDVLLVPRYSDVCSRSEVDISSDLGAGVKLELPIIASPMDTISESEMAITMAIAGGSAILHRYNTITEQIGLFGKALVGLDDYRIDNIGAAIGVTGDFLERAEALYDVGIRILCVDVAHGDHQLMKLALETLRKKLDNQVHIMAGNVATLDGFNNLADWGADSIRVGIGGGSICSTRIQTGHGVPTFQSILDCSRSDRSATLIADGGLKTSGDIVKALAAGADAVLLGSMLAGTDESPGEVFTNKSKKYKVYRGMASRSAQIDWRGSSSSPEGISTTIPYKGPVSLLLEDIAGGLRSGLSYSGSKCLVDLRTKCEFIKQTNAGQIESSTHILRR